MIHHVVTPYMPVPETNGEEWDRLEPMSALDALIDLVINGEYSGIESGKRKGKESLQLRAAGAMVFEVRGFHCDRVCRRAKADELVELCQERRH